MKTLALIGPGNVGRTLATLAAAEGYVIGPVFSRTLTAARKAAREMRAGRAADDYSALREADIILVTVPEEELEGVVSRLASAALDWRGKIVLSTSGVCAPDWGRPLHELGAAAGCFFPLQTFQRTLTSLAGVCFVLAGDTAAVREGRALAQALGATFALSSGGKKAQAALGALAASDLATAVFELAVRGFVDAGIRRKRAVEALQVLVERSLDDYVRSGTRSRPGPLLRGDADAVRRRLEAAAEHNPAEAERHRQALQLSLEILEADDPNFAFLDGGAHVRGARAGG